MNELSLLRRVDHLGILLKNCVCNLMIKSPTVLFLDLDINVKLHRCICMINHCSGFPQWNILELHLCHLRECPLILIKWDGSFWMCEFNNESQWWYVWYGKTAFSRKLLLSVVMHLNVLTSPVHICNSWVPAGTRFIVKYSTISHGLL